MKLNAGLLWSSGGRMSLYSMLSVILTRPTTCVTRPAQNTSPEAHLCDMKIDVLINVWVGQLHVVCMTSCAASGCTSACATRGKCTHNVACACALTRTRSTVELLRWSLWKWRHSCGNLWSIWREEKKTIKVSRASRGRVARAPDFSF